MGPEQRQVVRPCLGTMPTGTSVGVNESSARPNRPFERDQDQDVDSAPDLRSPDPDALPRDDDELRTDAAEQETFLNQVAE